MKILVRFAILLNWVIVFSTLFFWYKQEFHWSLIWTAIALLHIYILAYSDFSKDALSTYLKAKTRSVRHKQRRHRSST